jgi:cation transport ATPase
VEVRRGLRIPILDLGCGTSGHVVERELIATNGVLRAYVNPATETAYVDYDPAEVDSWALVRAIERAGYRPGHPRSDLAGLPRDGGTDAVGEVAKDER